MPLSTQMIFKTINMNPHKARKLIESIIRQRQMLIKAGKSKKDQAQMQYAIDHLKALLNAYPYATGQKMAGFIIRNQDEIRSLIPEGPQARKRQQDFNQLLEEAQHIKQYGTKSPEAIQGRMSFANRRPQ